MRAIARVSAAMLLGLVSGCGAPERETAGDGGVDAQGHTPPSSDTIRRHEAAAKDPAFASEQDLEDARRGLVASDPEVVIRAPDGRTIWDTTAYAFVGGDAPASVDPGLWRRAERNRIHGLFRVAGGIHQVRGYDLSNMTIIEGRTGWIVVDPLTAKETAAAALALARRHLGNAPVVAVIFTHSHVDHFGGIRGVFPDGVPQGVRVIAPRGFLEEATSENVLAGVAMGRRAGFMYGMPLARSARGHVDSGLGKEPARGTIGISEPTDLVDRAPQEMEIDGVRFVFQYAPDTEAPAELVFYLPDSGALCGAEVVSHTMHNLYTLRGAKVRDALRWSGAIDQAITLFPEAEMLFTSHHWPVWGQDRVAAHLARQRDLYKFIHDQTLRLANQGLTPAEIAEEIELPEALRSGLSERGYYGTLRHNAKAVYQLYFGWYDGNPSNLDPLPPAEAGRRYVALMGGADTVLREGAAAAERGEYRWAATLAGHLVFADPDSAAARELLARAYDQLGYQAESGPWRDAYLTGAFELRSGVPQNSLDLASAADLLRHTPVARFFDSMAARLDARAAEGKALVLNFVFTDVGETHVVRIENSVLHHRQEGAAAGADATVRLTRDFLVRLATGTAGLRDLVFSSDLDVDGSRMSLLSFFSLLDRPDGRFAIVTP